MKDSEQQEFFIALTARWRKKDGDLALGVTQNKLLQILNNDKTKLEALLETTKEEIASLGLEVIEYLYQGEVWYTVRSCYSCPSEIEEEEQAILASVIEMLEKKKQPETSYLSQSALTKKLVENNYISKHQLQKTLQQLSYLGYVKKNRQGIGYGPRTLIEFTQEARKHIAEESKKLIF